MMTMQSNDRYVASVPLTNAMHKRAEHLCPNYFSLAQSETIYLNALSVFAVEHYLKRLGYYPQLNLEMIENSVFQSLMDIAPIEVFTPSDSTVKGDRPPQPSYGCLECRRIMPTESTISIPESALNLERIGYLAIQFDDNLENATVLGYIQPKDINPENISQENISQENISQKPLNAGTINAVDMPLKKLRSLHTFCDYLESIRPDPIIDLNQWFNHIFQQGWELVDTLVPSQHLTLAVSRSITRSHPKSKRVERGKVVAIGDRGDQISLVLSIEQKNGSQFSISVEFWPVDCLYLPPNLHLAILDDQDQVVLATKTENKTPKAEITFDVDRGDRFQVRIENNETYVIQQFTL